jgi:hypothetical protein
MAAKQYMDKLVEARVLQEDLPSSMTFGGHGLGGMRTPSPSENLNQFFFRINVMINIPFRIADEPRKFPGVCLSRARDRQS